jgi:hypothetical protein
MSSQCGCSCGTCDSQQPSDDNKKLVITWQRLVSKGSTCPRCSVTEEELNRAVTELKNKLAPSGIKVIVRKKSLTLTEFKKNPLASNQILLYGRALVEVLNAETGQSPCCDVCGEEQCRTVETNGTSYESIPAKLIVTAGLLATNK